MTQGQIKALIQRLEDGRQQSKSWWGEDVNQIMLTNNDTFDTIIAGLYALCEESEEETK